MAKTRCSRRSTARTVPNLPQDKESSHSLLLKRGLFRIPLPWPPKNADGSPKPVEFTIEVVRDPTGCNTSPRIRSQERRADHFRLSPPAPRGESEVRRFRRHADRPQDRHAGRRRSRNRKARQHESHERRARAIAQDPGGQRHHGSRAGPQFPLRASRSKRSSSLSRRSTWRRRRTSSAALWP